MLRPCENAGVYLGFRIVARDEQTSAFVYASRNQWGMHVEKNGQEISRLYSRRLSLEAVLPKAQKVLDKHFPPDPKKVTWRYTSPGGYRFTALVDGLELYRTATSVRIVAYREDRQCLEYKNIKPENVVKERTHHSILDDAWAEAQARGSDHDEKGSAGL
jgi:hypothetical protein